MRYNSFHLHRISGLIFIVISIVIIHSGFCFSQQNDSYLPVYVNGSANIRLSSNISENKILSPKSRIKKNLTGNYEVNISFAGTIKANKDITGISIFSDPGDIKGSGIKKGNITTTEEKWDDEADDPCSKHSITNGRSSFDYNLENEGIDVSYSFDFYSKSGDLSLGSTFAEQGGTTNISGNCVQSTSLNSPMPSLINPFQNFALINQAKYNRDKLLNVDALISDKNTLDNFLLLFKNRIANFKSNESHTNFTVTYVKNSTIEVDGGTYVISKTLNIEFKTAPSQYEAELEIVPVYNYTNWLPLGPLFDDSLTGAPSSDQTTEHGNSISFQVKVYRRGTKELVSPPYKTKFMLKDVSKYPGICMNFPSANAERTPDLKFFEIPGTASQFENFSEDIVITKEDFGDQPVTVMSYDYGSFGIISAEVFIEGKTIKAISNINNKDFISIPFCQSNSRVAECWKSKMNSVNLSDADDNEANLSGVGDHTGDGLTLFEEYRGFSENKKHIRTNPKIKTLMICNQFRAGSTNGVDTLKQRVDDGINMFKQVTGSDVHADFIREEFGRIANPAVEGVDRDKCININYENNTHSVDQHGIWINRNPQKLGYCQAITKIVDGDIGTPKRYKYVDICADFDPSNEGWGTVSGTIDSLGNFVVDPTGQAKILTDVFARTIAHELLHCCNVHHHGEEGDYGTCTFFSGSVYPNLNLDTMKIYWFQGRGVPDSTTDIFEADMYDEGNPGIKLSGTDSRFRKATAKYVAGQGGNHSGVEDCLMRYDIARVILNNNKMYLINKKTGYYSELSGIKLCDSKTGTGVNKPGRKPFPRFGNASIGKCKKQFCVNDKHH